MKNLQLWFLVGALALLPACASYDRMLALQPVGPWPQAQPGGTGRGGLTVYSAWDLLGDRYFRDHSGYKILTADGTLVQWVSNAMSYDDEDPVTVELPAGLYQAVVESQNAGKVMVPVVIKAGQTTSVYLDGTHQLTTSRIDRDQVVKLPDGEVVGWAATAAR